MLHYLIRVCKYFIYCTVLLLLILALVFYTSDHGQLTHFWEMIPPSNYWQVALFLSAFAIVYPFVGFVKRSVYLNKPFVQDRGILLDPIIRANYRIEKEENNIITFRPKGAFTRFMRLYEDRMTLDFSDNPIVLEGMRRDVYRFARSMEFIVRRLSETEQ